jgi:hypothetical protein
MGGSASKRNLKEAKAEVAAKADGKDEKVGGSSGWTETGEGGSVNLLAAEAVGRADEGREGREWRAWRRIKGVKPITDLG